MMNYQLFKCVILERTNLDVFSIVSPLYIMIIHKRFIDTIFLLNSRVTRGRFTKFHIKKLIHSNSYQCQVCFDRYKVKYTICCGNPLWRESVLSCYCASCFKANYDECYMLDDVYVGNVYSRTFEVL
jgi:hypothetical protein